MPDTLEPELKKQALPAEAARAPRFESQGFEAHFIFSVLMDIKSSIARIEERIGHIEIRLDKMDTRFDKLDERVSKLEHRFTWLAGVGFIFIPIVGVILEIFRDKIVLLLH